MSTKKGALQISLLPKEDSLDIFEAREQQSNEKIVLFPGNIYESVWIHKVQAMLSGRAIDIQGKPIAGGLINTPAGYSFTDANGYFTYSGIIGDDFSIEKDDGTNCKVTFPDITSSGMFINLEDVTCKNID